ncbi:MAG: nucleoside 2-deoxyribosyltransferase [Nitrososphaerota archaeon]|uniref:nucleoside 2-deoxyribosyltransferase n=1 Tax=Candidatus Bathycorpusculum sp. TaxID=2994959 RepID=UPI002824D0A3|nr:nucleoside 2-deoxyribosyltransferase [Candidatus Termitimicrobium sp.]MCL2431055.1 nucleoside 2-deoxyribosyltransferase [Candidatus Termitimicrobium sp.]MDR0492825.1 nucleoside 2-deoxyribosyltransferase [Nitrososphaerota archaeon]
MVKQVFISGPIIGMENNQSYRQTIKDICYSLGLEIIDPWNREKVLYRGTEECWWKTYTTFDFVERDLADADRCDIMVVYLPVLSAGACMEMFYAKRRGKHVIVVTELPCVSPWIVVHSDKILKSLSELGETLKQFC